MAEVVWYVYGVSIIQCSMNINVEKFCGTHLPVLMDIVSKTDGPILEIGTGVFSTPYLHWACFNS